MTATITDRMLSGTGAGRGRDPGGFRSSGRGFESGSSNRSRELAIHARVNGEAIARVASAFSRLVREVLTEGELAQVRHLNATPEYQGTCATYDFVDADLLMHEAMLSQGGGDISARVGESDATAIWSAAWDRAQAAGFAL